MAAVNTMDGKALHRRALRLEWLTVAWNVVEALVAIGAGIISGSTALIAFGMDSVIEVASAIGLLWRLYSAGPEAEIGERGKAERRALYVVAGTFFDGTATPMVGAIALCGALAFVLAQMTPRREVAI